MKEKREYHTRYRLKKERWSSGAEYVKSAGNGSPAMNTRTGRVVMIIKTKFDIGQHLKIIGIDQPTTIIAIKQDGKDLFYECKYWWNGELKFVWLSESEIE